MNDDYDVTPDTENPEADLPETEEVVEEITDSPEPLEAEGGDPESPSTQEEKMVPYGALHSERKMRQEQARELAELRRWREVADERLAMLSKPPEYELPPPDFDEDPVAALNYKIDKLSGKFEGQEKQTQEQIQQQKYDRQRANLLDTYQREAGRFAEQQPDFRDGYKYWLSAWRQELETMGYSEREIPNVLEQEEEKLVLRALEAGDNPAERVYRAAKLRGYKPSGNPAQKIDQLKKGQSAARTMSGGGKTGAPLTAQALAEMSPEEFDEMLTKHPEQFRRAMGG